MEESGKGLYYCGTDDFVSIGITIKKYSPLALLL